MREGIIRIQDSIRIESSSLRVVVRKASVKSTGQPYGVLTGRDMLATNHQETNFLTFLTASHPQTTTYQVRNSSTSTHLSRPPILVPIWRPTPLQPAQAPPSPLHPRFTNPSPPPTSPSSKPQHPALSQPQAPPSHRPLFYLLFNTSPRLHSLCQVLTAASALPTLYIHPSSIVVLLCRRAKELSLTPGRYLPRPPPPKLQPQRKPASARLRNPSSLPFFPSRTLLPARPRIMARTGISCETCFSRRMGL